MRTSRQNESKQTHHVDNLECLRHVIACGTPRWESAYGDAAVEPDCAEALDQQRALACSSYGRPGCEEKKLNKNRKAFVTLLFLL